MSALYLVFSDLDGSLLDHDSYRYDAAKPLLELLESLRIPLMLVSSKTRAEMLALRSEMGNEHPFVVENGAAILIPEKYFLRAPADCELQDGYWVKTFAPPREQWAPVLDELRAQLPERFTDFASAGTDGIAEMTGMSLEKSALANERQYSEPVQWRGTDEELALFLQVLSEAGARVVRGGRFYAISGDGDKGSALEWLRQQFVLAASAHAVYDLAIGDGQNDVPMLEAAHRALLIPAHGRALPALRRSDGVLLGDGVGPVAWAHGVQAWLRELYTQPEDS